MPTWDCDRYRYATGSYLPGDRALRLVPNFVITGAPGRPAPRPARESDFEHAIPCSKGRGTDGVQQPAPRSRRCHRVKQLPGWTLTQPKPGWHSWSTPTGRTYVQEPWRYT